MVPVGVAAACRNRSKSEVLTMQPLRPESHVEAVQSAGGFVFVSVEVQPLDTGMFVVLEGIGRSSGIIGRDS